MQTKVYVMSRVAIMEVQYDWQVSTGPAGFRGSHSRGGPLVLQGV